MDSLLVQINSVLAQYTGVINQTMSNVMQTTAKEGVKKLKQTSPKAPNGGKYAKSWTVKREHGRYIIYNKQPGLTHLLENGHDVVVNGKKVGRAPAYPHIEEVNDWIDKTVTERLEKAL